ncbi:hypothetical protein DV738_g3943, partial [Chaetothyriales sp. CBS 135597]
MLTKTLTSIFLLATAAAATSGGGGKGEGGGAGSWAAWPSSSAPVAAAQANASPSPSSHPAAPASPVSLAAGEQLIQVVSVSDANGSLKYFPNSVQAPVGSIVQFQFHPKNHTITESTFAAPCQPIAQTNASLITATRPGIKSGFLPVKLTDTELPVYNVLINDTKPIWLYSAATTTSDAVVTAAAASGASSSSSTTTSSSASADAATFTGAAAPLLRPMEGAGGQIAAAAFIAGVVALL